MGMGFTVDKPAAGMTSIGPGLAAMPTTQGRAMGSRAPSRGLSPSPGGAENRGLSPAPRQKPGEGPLGGLGSLSRQGSAKAPLAQLTTPASPSMSSRGGHSMTSIGPGPLGMQGASAAGNMSMTSIGPQLGLRPNSAGPLESRSNPSGLSMM